MVRIWRFNNRWFRERK